MNKESIYYNRMFGYKKINYDLHTKTVKTCKTCGNRIITYYYVQFDNDKLEINEEEYNCLLKELEEECLKN